MRILKTIASLASIAGLLVAGAVTGPAAAGEDGKWMVKIQALGVFPDTKGANVVLPNGLAGLPAGTVLQDGADISDAWSLGADIGYFLTPNISLNLMCCFAQHDVETGGQFRALPGVGEQKIGKMWIFPPALTANYHFTGLGAWKPYVGAGVQYIHFFDEKPTGVMSTLGATKLTVDDAFGVVLQAGLDVHLGGGWYANADVKKVFLETDATYKAGNVTIARANIDLDPWIVAAGVGYRFNLDDLFRRGSSAPLK